MGIESNRTALVVDATERVHPVHILRLLVDAASLTIAMNNLVYESAHSFVVVAGSDHLVGDALLRARDLQDILASAPQSTYKCIYHI